AGCAAMAAAWPMSTGGTAIETPLQSFQLERHQLPAGGEMQGPSIAGDVHRNIIPRFARHRPQGAAHVVGLVARRWREVYTATGKAPGPPFPFHQLPAGLDLHLVGF